MFLSDYEKWQTRFIIITIHSRNNSKKCSDGSVTSRPQETMAEKTDRLTDRPTDRGTTSSYLGHEDTQELGQAGRLE